MEKTLTSLHCPQTWEKERICIKIPADKQAIEDGRTFTWYKFINN